MEKYYNEFFLNMRVVLRENGMQSDQKWESKEYKLQSVLEKQKEKIHECFQNNFDTANALLCINELMGATNSYCREQGIKQLLVQSILKYLKFIFKCLGMVYDQEQSVGGQSKEELMTPLIDAFVTFRNQNRTAAKDKNI